MSCCAVISSRCTGGQAFTHKNVFTAPYSAEVADVDTGPVAAKVVDGELRRDGPNRLDVNPAMHQSRIAVVTHLSVASISQAALPNQAIA